MKPAPQGAANVWQMILGSVAHAFTAPSYAIFVDLIQGWVCTPGRRTITRIITICDPTNRRAHDAYHRFLRDGVWHMHVLWRAIAVMAVNLAYPPGTRVQLAVDDTVFYKVGRRIEGVGVFRDAVRSTRNRLVYGLGLNLVVISLRIDPPFNGPPIALPIYARVRPKNAEHTLIDLARDMLGEITGWLPDRDFHLCGDGGYAPLVGADIDRMHITCRLRRDAALYELAPPPTGRPGRPRTKGERLPKPADIAAAATGWQQATYRQRNTTITRQIHTVVCLWYRVAKGRHVRLIIVRDPDGQEPDDYFITTDITTEVAVLVADYSARWSLEVTFRDVKQALGGEDPQSWKRQGPERGACLALWIHTATWLWYLQTWGPKRSWTPTPWYPHKTAPSFADALAALRTMLWHQRITPVWSNGPHPDETLDPILTALARAA